MRIVFDDVVLSLEDAPDSILYAKWDDWALPHSIHGPGDHWRAVGEAVWPKKRTLKRRVCHGKVEFTKN